MIICEVENLGCKKEEKISNSPSVGNQKVMCCTHICWYGWVATTTIEVEKVLIEIGETPFEPLKDERNEKLIEGETLID